MSDEQLRGKLRFTCSFDITLCDWLGSERQVTNNCTVTGQQVMIPAHMAMASPTAAAAIPQPFVQQMQHLQHIPVTHAAVQHPSGQIVLVPRIQRPPIWDRLWRAPCGTATWPAEADAAATTTSAPVLLPLRLLHRPSLHSSPSHPDGLCCGAFFFLSSPFSSLQPGYHFVLHILFVCFGISEWGVWIVWACLACVVSVVCRTSGACVDARASHVSGECSYTCVPCV